MENDIEFPGLVWVKDPVNPDSGEPTGQPPTMRHHEDCSHWHRDGDHNLIGPAPYRASGEQMRMLRACKTCATATGSATPRLGGKPRHGEPCPACGQEMPLTGVCDNCT